MAAERREPRPPGEALSRYLLWLVALSPVALPAAAAWWARSPRDRWWPMVVPASLGLLALSRYQDIAFSPRYLLTEFVVATTLPAAAWLDRSLPRRAQLLWIIPSLVLLPLAGHLLDARQRPLRELVAALPRDLQRVPRTRSSSRARPAPRCASPRASPATTAPPGKPLPLGGPPSARLVVARGPFGPRLEDALRQGRPVVLDLRDAAWAGRPASDSAAPSFSASPRRRRARG